MAGSNTFAWHYNNWGYYICHHSKTPVPTQRTKRFITTKDFQSTFSTNVYEGERVRREDNNLLGGFKFSGIHPAPRGETEFFVTFKIDHDGVLHVSAEKPVSGSKKQVTMINKARLNKQETDKMVQEAEKHRLEDEQFKKKVLAKKSLEEYAYSLKKLLKDYKIVSKIPGGNAKCIAEAVDKMMEWLNQDVPKDASMYNTKKKELEEISPPPPLEMS